MVFFHAEFRMAVGYLRSVQQIREVVDRCPQGEKVLHTMEMARPVVRRGRRKETTSCEFAGRFLVSHFTICIFCTCDVQKMRKRMYHAAAGSGIPYTPTVTFLWRLWCVPAATS